MALPSANCSPQKKGRRWSHHLDRLASVWALPPAERERRLARLVVAGGRLDEQPARRAEAAYLLGCHCFDVGDVARAVRMFECAYHDDDDYVTAAVLVFACLMLEVNPDGCVRESLLESWKKLRRPALLRRPRERALLAAISGKPLPAAGENLSPEFAFAWIPIERIHAALQNESPERVAGTVQ